MFWFPPQLLSETFLILRRTVRDTNKNVYRSLCKVPVVMMWRDIFVNCNWVIARWQYCSTHLHTDKNNVHNNRTTQITTNLARVRAVPRLCEFYPGICLTTEGKKSRKKPSCPTLRKLEFSRQFFRNKNSKIRFHENPSTGKRVVTDGQTGRS